MRQGLQTAARLVEEEYVCCSSGTTGRVDRFGATVPLLHYGSNRIVVYYLAKKHLSYLAASPGAANQ
jgi:hypothetical protein